MKNKSTKILLNVITIFLVLIIVLYFSLKDNYQEIINTILNINHIYLIIAIAILCMYRLITGVIYYQVIKINKEQFSLKRCIQLNFIIPFFHGITPFAGGGQPMEIYYLHKEGIPITKSANITLQNFIIYQIALVIVGVLSLLYNNIFKIFPEDNFIKRLVILGFLINLFVLIISFILSFGKKTQKKVINKVIKFLNKINLIKDKEKISIKLNEYLTSFHKNTIQLKKHKVIVTTLIFINIIGLFILYSMPYFIAKGMNIPVSITDTIVATAYVMIIGCFIPIPGGTGGIEYSFIFFYNYLIKGSAVNAIMLVWRFISYYFGMILGSIALSLYRKRSKI